MALLDQINQAQAEDKSLRKYGLISEIPDAEIRPIERNLAQKALGAYGEMLDAKYKKDLEIQKQVGKDHGTTLSVKKPTKAYTQPRHIQFKVSTVVHKENGKEPGKECCDVRLTTVKMENTTNHTHPRI